MWVVAIAIHVLLLAVLVNVKTHPTRVSSAGSPYGSMTAFLPGSVSAGPAASPAKPVAPKKPAMTTKAAKAVPADEQTGAGAAAAQGNAIGVGQGTGPVRFGAGGSLTLVKRVQPIYPPIMQSARMAGQVVLDAIIHPDGTIGDIKVLQSTNDAFARSAIAAVKQWMYSAPGFEGILTVTVNFTLNG